MKNYLFLFFFLALFNGELQAQNSLFDNSPKSIEKLKLNTNSSNVGPAIIDGKLYFSTLNENKKAKKQHTQFFELFSIPMNQAEIKDNKSYREEALISDYHNGPISYCEATGELFITQSDSGRIETKKGIINKKYVRLGIFIYQREKGDWKFKEEFPFNNSAYSVGHPAINQTGDTLIFVSDQKGGYGKTDLYYSIRENSIWQEPKNLGPVVNSKKRELTPFINSDGKLFFASDGHEGIGGLDLFWSKMELNQYTKPKNIGFPFNTKNDDFGLTVHPNQMIGYLTSNRNTKRKNDNIYRLKIKNYNLEILPIDSIKQQISSLKVQINKELSATVDEMKTKGLIANNVLCSADFNLIENDHIPDLKITYSYELLTDTLRLGLNTYKIGQYLPAESNVVMALLTAIKKDIHSRLNHFFTPKKRINLSISNTTDIFPFNEENLYKGEFGDVVNAKCTHNKLLKTFRIENQSKISYEELTFLRIYGMKNYLMSNVESLTRTINTFDCEIIMGDQIEKNQKWVKIEFIIQNAFGNF